MKCKECGHAIVDKGNFCPNCGSDLREYHKQSIQAGNQSFNFIGNNNEIKIHKIENQNTTNDNKPKEYEFIVGKKICKSKTIRFIGIFVTVIGVVGSVASIYSVLKNDLTLKSFQINGYTIFLFCIAFLIGTSMITFYRIISQRKFARILPNYIFGVDFQLLDDDSIAKVKISGKCPKCGGKLQLGYIQEKDHSMWICERNPKIHRFSFDHTLHSKNSDEEGKVISNS